MNKQMMQNPLKLAEVRHDQRRVAAMMQATPLKYHSIPSASLYHSSYYNHIKYNYLLHRSWRPLVSNNNTDGLVNLSTDTEKISLHDTNGIRHLYAKYHARQYSSLVQCDGPVNVTFPPVQPRGTPLVTGGVDQRGHARIDIAQKLSSYGNSKGVAHFLPKIQNGSSLVGNVDETWKVYNSRGLTKVKVRLSKNILSPSGTPTTELQTKVTVTPTSAGSPAKDLTDQSCDGHEKLKCKKSENIGRHLKLRSIHESELRKSDDRPIKKTYRKDNSELYTDFRQPTFRECENNTMYELSKGSNVAKNAIKLPSAKTIDKNKERNADAPAFRYTHRKFGEVVNLPTADEFKESTKGGRNNEAKPKSSVKKTVLNTGNRLKRVSGNSSKLKTRNKKEGASDMKRITESSTDSPILKVIEENMDENKFEYNNVDETTEETTSETTGVTSDGDSDTELTETDDSNECNLDGTLNSNDSNKSFKNNVRVNINDELRDPWRDAYVNALAVARSRRPIDLSFLESRTSRPFSFSYFEHVPNCKCKKCMERTMKNRGRAKKNVSEMKSIFGDVNLFDYYKP